MIVLGLCNTFARLPFRVRRILARLSGHRLIPFDPVLRDREDEPSRREAWLRDQSQHPEEHRHTLAEVQRWFAENGVDYVRSYPSALLGHDDADELFARAADNWRLEGPAFVWYFRGNPHVHVWVHVADDPSVKVNSRG